MDCFINRELSWLAFNQRVLENAASPDVPLCERLNFFSIFQSNLDEFFMVRIGSLHDQMLLDNESRENKTGLTPSQQITESLETIRRLCVHRDRVYPELLSGLSGQGISLVRFNEISQSAEQKLQRIFKKEILPYLSCYFISRKQDFPFLNNKEIYSIAVLEPDYINGKPQIAVIPGNSSVLPRLIAVPGNEGKFILVEEFILHFLPLMLPGKTIRGKALARITRNADIDADAVFDEDLDYRDHMASVIKQRKRLSPVRLELSRQLERSVIDTLLEMLNLEPSYVFEYDTPLDLSFLYQFSDMLRSQENLFYKPFQPAKLKTASGRVFDEALRHDILLHYPYDSFKTFLRLLHEAAADPKVTSIRMTLYRVARDSKVAEALAEASENGKTVEVFVELKARFDEENNIEWSRRLEQSGCHVIYGIEHIKVHSKLCLISWKDENGTERILSQVGTGNYNEKTSRIYTDLSLITADPAIGQDGLETFFALKEGGVINASRKLLVSPRLMHPSMIRLIEEEIAQGENGFIRLKMNSLTDKPLIDKLIEASRAGVTIQMVIRGICCLKAGVPGETENIEIRSIVGRFLEHSRIYLFGKDIRTRAYISSADWMTRNMVRRVEVAAPVSDPAQVNQLEDIFSAYWKDSSQAWEMTNDGHYRRRVPIDEDSFNAQESFIHSSGSNSTST